MSLENKLFYAFFRVDSKVAIFSYESPALTAELPDRCIATGWCDEFVVADGGILIVADGQRGERAGCGELLAVVLDCLVAGLEREVDGCLLSYTCS